MYKIAITGKANAGKNTAGKLLVKGLRENKITYGRGHFIAFADPIKEMARLAFPEVPRKWFYGPSKYRSEIIPGAFKDGIPLTVRQLLMDLGNDFGRKYQPERWVKTFDHRLNKLKKYDIIVVTDVRFRNEFDHLKNLGFFQIRMLRDEQLKIDDESETNQDGISNTEFDAVIYNNGTKKELQEQVNKIVPHLHE